MIGKDVRPIMLKRIIILLCTPLFLSAALFDFRALDQAQEAYNEGNYSKAIEAYATLEDKNDEVLYDEANSHYKLKEYEKAKELYASISKRTLAFKKWHNLGNCHAQLGTFDEGIKAYEEALKIKEDEDTRFNLELLKKKKKEQDKKEKKDDKNKKDSDKENNKEQDKKESDKTDKDKKSEEQKKEDEKKKQDKEKQEEDKKNDEKKKDNEKKKSDEEKTKAESQMKKEPISDKELRKYQKMLDQRGINTLMVPLETKGEDSDELKPW